MRKEIIEALCRSATAEEAALARSCARGKGNIIADLIEAGLHRRQVLAACTEVTGIPRAPSAWFKDHADVPLSGIDEEDCARHLFVPIAVEDGELCIAYGDPAVAVARDELELPAHRPYLATPTKVARAVKRLLARSSREATAETARGSGSGESSAFSNKRRKKKRNERRAASTEGVAVEAPPASPASAPLWEPTQELASSPAEAPPEREPPPPSRRAEPAPRPPPPRPSTLRVTSFQAGSAADSRSHGPLDPPLPPVGAARAKGPLDPPVPPPRGRPPPQQRAVRAAPQQQRAKAARPPEVPSTNGARTLLLVVVLLSVVGVAWIVFDRGKSKKRAATPTEEPVVVDDGQVDVTARQRALITRAKDEVSAVEAVNQLTYAINLDPASEAGRDAFLARARLYLASGQLERARRDLQRIQQRKDAAALRAEIDGLLAEIEKRAGPPTDATPRAADAGVPDAGAR